MVSRQRSLTLRPLKWCPRRRRNPSSQRRSVRKKVESKKVERKPKAMLRSSKRMNGAVSACRTGLRGRLIGYAWLVSCSWLLSSAFSEPPHVSKGTWLFGCRTQVSTHCWCADFYCPKPLPTPARSIASCAADNYCGKPLPYVARPAWCGCNDGYCPKPLVSVPRCCEPWYRCANPQCCEHANIPLAVPPAPAVDAVRGKR